MFNVMITRYVDQYKRKIKQEQVQLLLKAQGCAINLPPVILGFMRRM